MKWHTLFGLVGALLVLDGAGIVLAASLGTRVLVSVFPNAPTSLGATAAAPTQITLAWTDNSNNEDGFSIERKTDVGGTYAQIATTSANVATYIDNSVSASTVYFYRVLGFNSDGNSLYSNEASTTTPSAGGGSPPPPPPSGSGGGGGGGYSPVVTQAIFRGMAYPGSNVTLLKDAQVAASIAAGQDGRFEIELNGLSAGYYSFGVWAEDKDGTRSLTQTFLVAVTTGVTTVVSGIFLSPTIASDKVEVKKGDVITFFGKAVPASNVSVYINSTEELIKKTQADVAGVWLYKFDTDEIGYGDHTAKARAARDADISLYSNVLGFKVGVTNVAAPIVSPKKTLKGNLNQDGKVNLIDFSILAYWYQRAVPAATLKKIDLNGDGKISLIDFSIMAYYWTG